MLRIAAVLLALVAITFTYRYKKRVEWLESARYAVKYQQGRLEKAAPSAREHLQGEVRRAREDVGYNEINTRRELQRLLAAGALSLLLGGLSIWTGARAKKKRAES